MPYTTAAAEPPSVNATERGFVSPGPICPKRHFYRCRGTVPSTSSSPQPFFLAQGLAVGRATASVRRIGGRQGFSGRCANTELQRTPYVGRF